MFLTKLEFACASWVYQEVNTFMSVSVIWWYNGFAVSHFQSRSVLANKLTTNNEIPVRNYPLNYLSVKKANWMEDTWAFLRKILRLCYNHTWEWLFFFNNFAWTTGCEVIFFYITHRKITWLGEDRIIAQPEALDLVKAAEEVQLPV